MGVHGLWAILEPCAQPISLETLEGKRLAIDISIWIHEAQQPHFASTSRQPALELLVSRLCKLLHYKIRPIFVFDGPHVPTLKRRVLADRQLRRAAAEARLQERQTQALRQHLNDNSDDTDLARKIRVATQATSASLDHQEIDQPIHISPDDFDDLLSSESESSDLYDEEDDDDDVVEDEVSLSPVKSSPRKNPSTLSELVETRALMRGERVANTAVLAGKSADELSHFQLDRLLRRGRVSQKIEALSQAAIRKSGFREGAVLLNDGRTRLHVLENLTQGDKRDDDDHGDVVETQKDDDTKKSEPDAEVEGEERFSPTRLPQIALIGEKSTPVRRWSIDDDDNDGDDKGVEPIRAPKTRAHPENDDPELQEAIRRSLIDQERHVERVSQIPEDDVCEMSDSWSDSSEEAPAKMPKIEKPPRNSAATPFEQPTNLVPGGWNLDDRVQFDCQPSTSARSKLDSSPAFGDSQQPPVYALLQECLNVVGCAYIIAPGEAEAECARLQSSGLADAVCTEDSDAWLFGATGIVRRLFSHGHLTPQRYEWRRIEETTGLTRADLVVLTMLSGGDYARGLKGCGAVGALELLADFGRKSTEKDVKGAAETVLEEVKRFLWKSPNTKTPSARSLILRKRLETLNTTEAFDQIDFAEALLAYTAPRVGKERPKFAWKSADPEVLEALMHRSLGWDANKFSKTAKALERWNAFVARRESHQMRLTGWLAEAQVLEFSPGELRLKQSKRASTALVKLAKRRGRRIQLMDDDEHVEEKEKEGEEELSEQVVQRFREAKRTRPKTTPKKRRRRRKSEESDEDEGSDEWQEV